MSDSIKTEFDFTLTKKFGYSFKGDTVEASFIRLTAPSAKQQMLCVELKQYFLRAASEMPDSDKTDDSGDPKGEDFIKMLYISSVDMKKVVATGRELLTSGVALVDGEVKLIKPLIDLFSYNDSENMLGEYCLNFILLSVLNGTS